MAREVTGHYRQGRIDIEDRSDGSRRLTHPTGVTVEETARQRRDLLDDLIHQRDRLNEEIEQLTSELPPDLPDQAQRP